MHTKEGTLTVRSAYHLQLSQARYYGISSYHHYTDWNWQAIWKMQVPAVVKHFILLAAYDILLTKQNLMKRKMLQKAGCLICEKKEENILHALWSCPGVSDVWG